jgi:chromosome segregation ATPase
VGRQREREEALEARVRALETEQGAAERRERALRELVAEKDEWQRTLVAELEQARAQAAAAEGALAEARERLELREEEVAQSRREEAQLQDLLEGLRRELAELQALRPRHTELQGEAEGLRRRIHQLEEDTRRLPSLQVTPCRARSTLCSVER